MRVALLDINHQMSEQDANGMNLQSPRVHVNAGPHRVSAAFLRQFEAPVDDILAPQDYTLADSQIGSGFGITTLPHVRDFAISGPFEVTGVSDTVSRRAVFSCRPTTAAEEAGCATEILKRLASQAYREPASDADVTALMAFFERGRKDADFEAGIRAALEALLASPRFVFRLEQPPPTARVGDTFAVADLDLASRLSFFLWGTAPDAELVRAASTGGLKTPAGLEKQVRRMLADPRSEALATRFAHQWLRLQDVEKIRPDALLFPYWDYTLAANLVRETELFFDSLVRDDRSILDLLACRLHLRQRARRPPLRHPQRDGPGVPPRGRARRAARHPRPRQHPAADLGGRSHLAGAARQVGDGSAARLAAAAARRPTCRCSRRPAAPATARCCRCASGWKSIARTRPAPRATR